MFEWTSQEEVVQVSRKKVNIALTAMKEKHPKPVNEDGNMRQVMKENKAWI